MYPLGIAAPDPDAASSLRERVLAGLGDRGSVALVERGRTEPPMVDGAEGAAATYRFADGRWTGTGTAGSLTDVLSDLAPGHDYAVLSGFPDATVPFVVLGEVEVAGRVLLAGSTPDDISVAAVVDALESTEPFETLESLVARAKRSPDADKAGAIATFTGRVREHDGPDDPSTTHLEFEKYAGVAEERMGEVAAALEERDGVYAVIMHHRTGVLEAGEDIVFVVVLAGHRTEAFRTVSDGIDRLKAEVPIFKKEVTVEDSYWVHERM